MSEPIEAPAPEDVLAAQHKEWKLRAVEALHNFAEERDWCAAFDEILNRVGLPGRWDYVESDACNIEGTEPVGEDTVEAFEQWRRETSKTFHHEIRRHGYTPDSFDEPLREIGFLGRDELYKTVQVRIEGKFSLPLEVEVPVDGNLIDSIDNDNNINPGYLVRSWTYTSDFTWKAVVDDGKEAESE